MIARSFIIVFVSLVLNFLFPDGGVKVNLDAPSVVDAGKSFRVTVTLSKKDLTGFSRFAQDIPPGLTATANNSANADFTFKDNRVRFIWLKLPDLDSFTISYDIRVDERLKGTFDLTGKFSFIENNERKSVDYPGKQITIRPSPNIDPRLIVDIKDFKQEVVPEITPVSGEDVACVRQRPDLTYSNKEILVNILVNKGTRQKFAKIEEQIPEGYVAVAVDKKDAIFAFRDQVAKFLWMNLPAEPYFTVSYKLVPQNKIKADSLRISGNFSYIEGEKNFTVPIVEEDVAFDNLNRDRVNRILAAIPGYLARQKQKTNVVQPAVDTTGTPLAYGTGKTGKNTVKPGKNGKETGKTVIVPGTKETTAKTIDTARHGILYALRRHRRDSINLALLLEPETGVYYRVQIAAGHKPVPIRRYFRKLTFNEDIKTEQDQGWYKYSIGSWNDYKEARDFRLHVWTTTPIKDAFVAAYNNGKRITVQEALMISNQKWYR